MQPSDVNWAKAFAKQSLSDLNVREALVTARVEKCHRLHYLQMAAEKVCKAFLSTSKGQGQVGRTHSVVERNLPILARQFYAVINSNNDMARWELSEVRKLAREIELLAPAIRDGGSREDNTEYPWLDSGGAIRIPCEHTFPGLCDNSRTIVRLIRLMRTAAESYLR